MSGRKLIGLITNVVAVVVLIGAIIVAPTASLDVIAAGLAMGIGGTTLLIL